MSLTTEDKIIKAKIKLQQRQPFFAYILMRMKMQENPNIQTCGVNARGDMYWNKEFIENLSTEKLMGLLCHETMHLALMHLTRRGTRDARMFNISNDLVANDVLVEEGFELPEGGIIPSHHEYTFEQGLTITNIHEKSSEEIYEEILKQQEEQEKGEGGGGQEQKGEGQESTGQGFDEHIYTEQGEELSNEEKHEWKKIISEAANNAKSQGKLPAGMERRIEGLLESKINWREKLYRYMQNLIIHDFTWSRPSKRTASLGIHTPAPVKESIKIVVSLDTSGSITKDELTEFVSELKSISNSCYGLNVDLIICDRQVHETYSLDQNEIDDVLKMKISGGGGTDHRPVYQYVEENIHDAKVLINFTDGYTNFPDDEYDFDTLWVLTKESCSEKNIPFGEVIKQEV